MLQINMVAGWVGFLFGVVSGALIGLFFHKQEWLGGYGSFRRRLLRLGHISFFGLGLINILFALCTKDEAGSQWLALASVSMLAGAVTMPLNCFLTAWQEKFRHLFFVPVGSMLIGIGALLAHWGTKL